MGICPAKVGAAVFEPFESVMEFFNSSSSILPPATRSGTQTGLPTDLFSLGNRSATTPLTRDDSFLGDILGSDFFTSVKKGALSMIPSQATAENGTNYTSLPIQPLPNFTALVENTQVVYETAKERAQSAYAVAQSYIQSGSKKIAAAQGALSSGIASGKEFAKPVVQQLSSGLETTSNVASSVVKVFKVVGTGIKTYSGELVAAAGVLTPLGIFAHNKLKPKPLTSHQRTVRSIQTQLASPERNRGGLQAGSPASPSRRKRAE